MPSTTTSIQRDNDALDLLIEYTVHAAERQTWDYPGAPAHVGIDRVRCIGCGHEVELTDSEAEAVRKEIEEDWAARERDLELDAKIRE